MPKKPSKKQSVRRKPVAASKARPKPKRPAPGKKASPAPKKPKVKPKVKTAAKPRPAVKAKAKPIRRAKVAAKPRRPVRAVPRVKAKAKPVAKPKVAVSRAPAAKAKLTAVNAKPKAPSVAKGKPVGPPVLAKPARPTPFGMRLGSRPVGPPAPSRPLPPPEPPPPPSPPVGKSRSRRGAPVVAQQAARKGPPGLPLRSAQGRASPLKPPGAAGVAPKVELAPRRHVSVTPSIPLPVQAPPKKASMQQRARRIDHRLMRQSSEFQGRYQHNFDMSWIYHDAALEGVVYTFGELSSALEPGATPPADSGLLPVFDAVRRQQAAIEFVRATAAKRRAPLNVDLIKALYTILHPEDGDVKTVRYRRDVPQHRLYFHEYAPPDKITYRLRQVIDWLNSPETRKKVGTLRMAAKAHYDLARTYPFPTDSGKVARLFTNILLLRGGLPPAIIHATERQRYYEALKAGTPSSLFTMLRDSVENSLASIEKLLDEHETRKRAFIA